MAAPGPHQWVPTTIRPGHAAIEYSWTTSPRRSVLRSQAASDLVGWRRSGSKSCRRQLAEGPVGAVGVVMLDVLCQDRFKMALVEDEHPVETVAPQGPNDAFADGVWGWPGATAGES